MAMEEQIILDGSSANETKKVELEEDNYAPLTRSFLLL